MMSPRDLAIPDFRQDVEERSRLMQRDSSGLPKENGELRKSLESPQRGTPVSAGGGAGPPPIPGLPPHLNFNPLMFGGLPSLESLRKEDLEAAAAAVGIPKRPPIPNIPNVPSVSLASGGGGFCPLSMFKIRTNLISQDTPNKHEQIMCSTLTESLLISQTELKLKLY